MEQTQFPREIFIKANNPEDYAITVFLGVFNGQEYLESLKSQLLSQETQDFHLVVVDNDSQDESLSELANWESEFRSRITVVKNSFNLGGTGTLVNNFDLISTPWFTSFHQDDFYEPKHLRVLIERIKKVPDDVVAISTVMASMDGEGKKVGTIARASMFTLSTDPISSFLQNLRTHSVPWPATAFKSKVYAETFSSLHSSAFPDTEQILRMCAYGNFTTVDEETMFYRENALSESHSIISAESELGAALTICRVLNSPDFTKLVQQINDDEIGDFASGLLKAIDFRLKDSKLTGFTVYTAIESLIANLGYRDQHLVSLARNLYEELGSKTTSALLARIAKQKKTASPIKELNLNFSIGRFNANLRSGNLEAKNSAGPLNALFKLALFQSLSYRLKKRIIRIAIFCSQKLGKSKQFNFEWKNKRESHE